MSSSTDSAAIFNYHRDMMKKHGPVSSFAQGWRNQESQLIRFGALATIADLSNCSILDVGCGYGDLLPYLSAIYANIKYTGIEQIPEFLDKAMGRYGNSQHTSFLYGNFTTMDLPVAEYVLASGSLNYRSSDPGFIFNAIDKLYTACKSGFAFNLLSEIIPNGLIVAYNPEQIFQYCSSLCPKVKLVRDYDPDDFTVYMYK